MMAVLRELMPENRRRRATDVSTEPWWIAPLELLLKQGVGAVVAIIIVVWWTRDASAKLDAIVTKTDAHVKQMQQIAVDEERDRRVSIALQNLQCSFVAKNADERAMCNDVVRAAGYGGGRPHP